MSYLLNDRLKALNAYQPISGEYQIRLDANESFITLPEALLHQAAEEALAQPLNRYPDSAAYELCKSFASFYNIRPDHVTAGNGSDELISLLVGTFFSEGEELVTLSHDFSMYRFYGETFGVKTSIYPKREDLSIDVEGLIQYINLSGARGLIFSNPCNPTSICLDKKEILRLVRSVENCLVVVDEAYMDFADESVLKEVHEFDNLIVLKTCSKAIGLAGIRLGFAVACSRLTNLLHAVKSPYNVNTLSQCFGKVILSSGDYLIDCIEKVIYARDFLYQGFMHLYATHKLLDEIYTTSTNFVFIKTRYAKPIYEALLKRSIAVRVMDGYLRISAGTRKENEMVLKAIDEILTEME